MNVTSFATPANLDSLPATAKYHVGLPDRPEPSASLDAYVAYLDAMCAHVRGMAVKAGRLYHEAKLAELEVSTGYRCPRCGDLDGAAHECPCICGTEGPDEFGNYDQIEHPECPIHGGTA